MRQMVGCQPPETAISVKRPCEGMWWSQLRDPVRACAGVHRCTSWGACDSASSDLGFSALFLCWCLGFGSGSPSTAGWDTDPARVFVPLKPLGFRLASDHWILLAAVAALGAPPTWEPLAAATILVPVPKPPSAWAWASQGDSNIFTTKLYSLLGVTPQQET